MVFNVHDILISSLTKRETATILISTIIEMKLDFPDSTISSVNDKKRAAASNINHIEIIRKLSIFTWSIDMAPSLP